MWSDGLTGGQTCDSRRPVRGVVKVLPRLQAQTGYNGFPLDPPPALDGVDVSAPQDAAITPLALGLGLGHRLGLRLDRDRNVMVKPRAFSEIWMRPTLIALARPVHVHPPRDEYFGFVHFLRARPSPPPQERAP